MAQIQSTRQYDLESRTFEFARCTRRFLKEIPKTISNLEDIKQLMRSSGSIGANYIEANEALGKKDFIFRVRIARKEAKETIYWLKLLAVSAEAEKERTVLIQEATELMKIFGAIIRKSE